MAETLSYFTLLGVGEDVSQDELEARYQKLADHLASPAIPAHLREWARRQAALVDEAYAALSDPERRAAVRSERQTPAAADIGARSVPQAPMAGRTGQTKGRDTEQRGEPPRERKRPAGSERATQADAGPGPSGPGLFGGLVSPRLRPVILGILIGLAVLGAILLGRYGLPSNEAGEATEPDEASVLVPLDTERIAELMEAVQEDPSDPEVLFELGETFFQGNEWQSAIDWFTRLLAVDPENVHARTDVGTANFNLGNFEEAEAAWLAVVEIDPDDVQAHYNLGFVYANAEPQDIVSARREWEKVVSLAPDSELASIAQAHLDALPEEAGETGETD